VSNVDALASPETEGRWRAGFEVELVVDGALTRGVQL
jgi:hypothetical protein